MKTILKTNIAKLVSQFTLENLTTERACLIVDGWQNIKIDADFKKESILQIAELLGGGDKTKQIIKFKINNNPVYGWYAQRIIFEPLRNKWVYIAGQDYQSEIAQIRKSISNL